MPSTLIQGLPAHNRAKVLAAQESFEQALADAEKAMELASGQELAKDDAEN